MISKMHSRAIHFWVKRNRSRHFQIIKPIVEGAYTRLMKRIKELLKMCIFFLRPTSESCFSDNC